MLTVKVDRGKIQLPRPELPGLLKIFCPSFILQGTGWNELNTTFLLDDLDLFIAIGVEQPDLKIGRLGGEHGFKQAGQPV